jgi:hypothetical protein
MTVHKLQVPREMHACGQYTVAAIAKTFGVSRASIAVSGTPGALLSSDNYGSSVERTAKLHPLWQRAFEMGNSRRG